MKVCLRQLLYKVYIPSFVICNLSFVILLGGCGTTRESSFFSYAPSWTRDGQVIFIRGLQSGSAYTENLLAMFATGTGESTAFADVTNSAPYGLSCSPNRDYAAYLTGLRTGLYNTIVVRSLSTEAYTGMSELELVFDPDLKSFDWSPDGNTIVYCTTTEVRTRGWNDFVGTTDTLVTAEANLSFVSWKSGGRIAFVHTTGSTKLLSLIYPDGSGRRNMLAAASVDRPQINPTNTNEVFGIVGGSYCSVEVAAASPATTEIKANFAGVLPRISSDGARVVYSKSGESSGIYLLYLATGTEETIKR